MEARERNAYVLWGITKAVCLLGATGAGVGCLLFGGEKKKEGGRGEVCGAAVE